MRASSAAMEVACQTRNGCLPRRSWVTGNRGTIVNCQQKILRTAFKLSHLGSWGSRITCCQPNPVSKSWSEIWDRQGEMPSLWEVFSKRLSSKIGSVCVCYFVLLSWEFLILYMIYKYFLLFSLLFSPFCWSLETQIVYLWWFCGLCFWY